MVLRQRALVVAWFDTKVFDETGDEELAQGWTVQVLDTNGNGRRDEYVEPGEPIDPAKDARIERGFYGVAPSPLDGSIWGSTLGFPGGLVRLVPGDDPVDTALAEFYEVPWNESDAEVQGFSPRGMDVDSDGVVWTVLASGHFASFDRTKCTGPLNGPTATGRHCPEGWALYQFPGPNFKGAVDSGAAESAYYNFTDRFDLLGLGENIPLATGNLSEGVLALVDGEFHNFRVPYPLGSFFGKGSTGASTTPTPAGRGAASGRRRAAAPRSTPRGERSAWRRSSSSRCGRTRWPTSRGPRGP